MTKIAAQEGIKKLVEKYQLALKENRANKYTEEETKKDFILPFFRFLGWDVDDKREVSAEEAQSGGRVDYGFYINGNPKFYLEAKPLKADLNREEYARQAIRYSWNKGVTWAVLTDFEGIKVFNAQDTKQSLAGKKYFSISYSEYLDRFDEIWLLSRESIETGLIDREAEKRGKKYERVPITTQLSKDISECRDILTYSLSNWNKISGSLLDEGVQKLLDRLIFLRVAEDRGIEKPILIPLIREWQSRKDRNEVSLYQSMSALFRELDKVYDSGLFSEHPFEKWEEHDGATEKVIKILYGKEGYYEYDFKIMPADVLGALYENYLSHQLAKADKKAQKLFGNEDVVVIKDAKKRKEQGIYYTPTFIVNYIVKNALQPVLDKCTTIDQLKKIKVLDPACGSGSFLLAAVEMIYKKYFEMGRRGQAFFTKTEILTENIYGVDLDQKAVEIARLNLLINALDQQISLPSLAQNIKNGNSLISGTDTELKKYFGKEYHDKKPFNWHEEFPEVFKQGGFDVIIGNPPYIDSEEMSKSQPGFRNYCTKNYAAAKGNWDLFCIFIERGLNLLKDQGRLGMIIPNKLISAKYAADTRSLLSANKILSISDYSTIAVFGASVYPIVVIVSKGEDKNDNFEVIVNHGIDFPTSFSKRIFPSKILSGYKDGWAPLFEEKEANNFLDRIIRQFSKLGDLKFFSVVGAATVSEAYEIKKIIREIPKNESQDFKFINTGTIDRYSSLWGNKPTRYIKDSYLKPSIGKEEFKKIYQKRYAQANSPKIIIGGMSKFLECFFDKDGQYVPGKSTAIILGQNLSSLKILVAVLNSKLLSVIYSRVFKSLSLAGGFFRIGSPQIKLLPISFPEGEIAENFIIIVDQRIMLNDKLLEITENSNEWESLKNEIGKTDAKIDALVYQLYGLTENEIKIVEAE